MTRPTFARPRQAANPPPGGRAAGWIALLLAMAAMPTPAAGQADEPYLPPPAPEMTAGAEQDGDAPMAAGRIGRVSLLEGEARWFAASSSNDWIRAQPNLPITANSSVATARAARVEIRVGTITVAVDGESQADFLQVADDVLAVRVARGRVAIATAHLDDAERIELTAGHSGLVVRSAGRFAFGFDAQHGRSLGQVHEGLADLRIGEATLPLHAGEEASIDTEGPLSQDRRQLVADGFDRWLADRHAHWQRLADAAPGPIPPEMTGAEELAAHGQWQEDPSLGMVWYPAGTAASWSPQSDGRWEAVEPLGQVWVATASWGFITAHYGRWHRIRDRWGWVPARQMHDRRPGPTVEMRPAVRPGLTVEVRPAVPPRPPGAGAARPLPPGQWHPDPPRQPSPQPPGDWHLHPPRHSPPHQLAPRFDPGPAGFPTPPRAYPTPPRQYPSPLRPWPPGERN